MLVIWTFQINCFWYQHFLYCLSTSYFIDLCSYLCYSHFSACMVNFDQMPDSVNVHYCFLAFAVLLKKVLDFILVCSAELFGIS